MLVDCKNSSLEVGQRVRVESDIPSPDGMLYRNQLVKILALPVFIYKIPSILENYH